MSKFEKAVADFKEGVAELGLHQHDVLYDAIAKHLGPSIHDKDAALVACSDPAEKETIKKNFLIGHLGLNDAPELDQAIDQVCGLLGKDNKKKHRVTFYYLLVGLLNLEHRFIDASGQVDPY